MGGVFADLIYCVRLIEVQSTWQNHHSYTTADTGFSRASHHRQEMTNLAVRFIIWNVAMIREDVSSAY